MNRARRVMAAMREGPAGAAWGAALTVACGWVLWLAPGLGPWLTALSYDALYLVAPPQRVTEAALVMLDEGSYRRLGQSPDRLWDRALHARLIESLVGQGARAVVFDVLFADPWPDARVDEGLARAMREASGKVVLAASVQFEARAGQANVTTCLTPTERLAAVAPWGVVEVPMEVDRTLRQHWRHPGYPSLSSRTVELLGRSPGAPDRARWIRFYGPPGTIPPISCWQALEPGADAAALVSNRVVFVGKGAVIGPQGANPTDDYAIPHTRWSGRRLSGVELQATLFLNLWRGDWLEELPWWTEAALLALGGSVAGFGLARLRPRPALAAAVIGAGLVGVLALGLGWSVGVWFPWLVVSAVQLPCALAWSVLSFVQRAADQEGIPDHTLLRCIGRGGYGEVWLARDAIGGYHAVKVLERRRFARSDPFEREFRGMEQFAPLSRSHPGLVHILHVGRNELRGSFYYIMELADAQQGVPVLDPATYAPRTLASELAANRRLPARRCFELGIELAGALDHLHRHGLVHRDVKPANILFVGGRPKLGDPGLVARVLPPGEAMSRVGTEGYLAPEGPGTPGADVYGLGKALYEAATGCEAACFPELPTDLAEAPDRDLVLHLHQVLLTACETEPADRYATAAALQADLERLRARAGPTPPTPL